MFISTQFQTNVSTGPSTTLSSSQLLSLPQVTIQLNNLSDKVDANTIELKVSAHEIVVKSPLTNFTNNNDNNTEETEKGGSVAIASVKLTSDKVVFNASNTKASLKRKLGKLTFSIVLNRK